VKKTLLIISFFVSIIAFSADSTRIDTSYIHSRKKAAIWSTVLPGAGQFYNEYGHRKVQGRANLSWWRAPLFWAGLGATSYLAYYNGSRAKSLKTEWLQRQETGVKVEYLTYSDDELINGVYQQFTGFDDHAKYRDYSIVGFVLVYGLNIADAYVDAHFVTFDVSQNLALHFKPKMFTTNAYGLSLALKFK